MHVRGVGAGRRRGRSAKAAGCVFRGLTERKVDAVEERSHLRCGLVVVRAYLEQSRAIHVQRAIECARLVAERLKLFPRQGGAAELG